MFCGYCEFRCGLEAGEGICGRYAAKNGRVVEKEPFRFLQPYFHDMESMPFFHVAPGRQVLQIGSKGCNAGCDYCINAHLALERSDYDLIHYSPEDLVRLAKDRMIDAIVFGINEITVSLPSAIEVAKAAREAGLLAGCLTNGFLTEEAAAELAAHMDMINVSLKSMSDAFYRESLKLTSVEPVLRNIRIFHSRSHLEIVTPIAQEITMEELHSMADFIAGIDSSIPWHLFRLYKNYQRINEKGRDFEETIAFTEAIRKRLPYTYFGNFPGSQWEDTICPACGHRVIRRISIGACGARYLKDDLTEDDACSKCGNLIPILRP